MQGPPRGRIASALALAVVVACTQGDERGEEDVSMAPPARPQDGGAESPAPSTGGRQAPPFNPFDASLPMFTPPSGSRCVLEVAAQCDGPEDCAAGESCCGRYDPLMLTYASIACSASCTGSNLYALCHDVDACAEGHVCRRSRILPHDFIAVCALQAPVPAEQTGRAITGEVVCGSTTCAVGAEQCCLSGEFVFETMSLDPLAPYCAPLGSTCSCEGPPIELDAGSEGDAG